MTVELEEHYDRFYDGPSEWRLIGAQAKAANIVELWRSGKRATDPIDPVVLDIGCGDGAVLAALSGIAEGWHCQGLEISTSALAACKERGVDAEAFDGRRVPLADQSVDLCVLSHVVEHLENPRSLLAEACRVGRWVFVEVPLEYTMRTPTDFVWTDVGHINLYDPRLIRHLLQSCGLQLAAQRLSNSTRQLYVYASGRARGTLKWLAKEGAVRISRRLACRVFVYNYSVLALSPHFDSEQSS